jgi:hypothetical protein
MKPLVIERWHALVESRDPRGLDALLAEDATFHSPIVHTPQVGKALTRGYLLAAMEILLSGSFRYVNEWYAERSAVLEFEAVVDGITIQGVDIIHWNAEDRIVRFKVMVRPLKAINLLHQAMARALAAAAPAH